MGSLIGLKAASPGIYWRIWMAHTAGAPLQSSSSHQVSRFGMSRKAGWVAYSFPGFDRAGTHWNCTHALALSAFTSSKGSSACSTSCQS